jgi:hypothetical protein
LQLKADGHGKYSESIKRCFSEFETDYNSEYTIECLNRLSHYKENLTPILRNIEKIVVNRSVKDFSARLVTELDRLISIQEKSSTLNAEEQDQGSTSKSK